MNTPQFVLQEALRATTRRHFFRQCGVGLGGMALTSLLGEKLFAATPASPVNPLAPRAPHFPAKAKRVIYLFQSGAPSQIDLFDPKPKLDELRATELPDSIRQGQRLTGMTATQDRFPIAPSKFRFAQHGRSGAWLSELLPHTARVADDVCFVRSMFTEAINHDPAMTFFQTGSQIAGRPSIGAWVNYGLGTMNDNLPAFVVLVTRKPVDQPVYSRLWGNGFLDSRYQGVRFSSGNDPVYYLSNPDGVCGTGRPHRGKSQRRSAGWGSGVRCRSPRRLPFRSRRTRARRFPDAS